MHSSYQHGAWTLNFSERWKKLNQGFGEGMGFSTEFVCKLSTTNVVNLLDTFTVTLSVVMLQESRGISVFLCLVFGNNNLTLALGWEIIKPFSPHISWSSYSFPNWKTLGQKDSRPLKMFNDRIFGPMSGKDDEKEGFSLSLADVLE